jgi:hypothetical protein
MATLARGDGLNVPQTQAAASSNPKPQRTQLFVRALTYSRVKGLMFMVHSEPQKQRTENIHNSLDCNKRNDHSVINPTQTNSG